MCRPESGCLCRGEEGLGKTSAIKGGQRKMCPRGKPRGAIEVGGGRGLSAFTECVMENIESECITHVRGDYFYHYFQGF